MIEFMFLNIMILEAQVNQKSKLFFNIGIFRKNVKNSITYLQWVS